MEYIERPGINNNFLYYVQLYDFSNKSSISSSIMKIHSSSQFDYNLSHIITKCAIKACSIDAITGCLKMFVSRNIFDSSRRESVNTIACVRMHNELAGMGNIIPH